MNHIGTRKFETERLICRKFEISDSKDAFRYWASNPNIQLEYGEPVYDTLDKTVDLINRYINNYINEDYYRWAIVQKDTGENIGQIAFCKVYSERKIAEIEYCIGENFWGHGYAREALNGLIGYAFSKTDFEKLEAYHRIENTKSGKVLEKSLMHTCDNVERFRIENKEPQGEVCYCIEREFWSEE